LQGGNVQEAPPRRAAARQAGRPARRLGGPAAFQRAFVAEVLAARTAFRDAANDMEAGAVPVRRDAALCRLVRQSGAARDWRGHVARLGAAGNGAGTLSVTIGPDVMLSTSSNKFSWADAGTLIPLDSPLYRQAVALRVGQPVRVSGTFLEDMRTRTCPVEKSLTRAGSALRPEFLFRFTAIAPAD